MALEELPAPQRAALLLREVEGLSYQEIAEVLGCAVGTVMSRLHYARRRLQLRLRPFLEE
jgi:RNA polymerase sigma-70 factor (ECF subfamily)